MCVHTPGASCHGSGAGFLARSPTWGNARWDWSALPSLPQGGTHIGTLLPSVAFRFSMSLLPAQMPQRLRTPSAALRKRAHATRLPPTGLCGVAHQRARTRGRRDVPLPFFAIDTPPGPTPHGPGPPRGRKIDFRRWGTPRQREGADCPSRTRLARARGGWSQGSRLSGKHVGGNVPLPCHGSPCARNGRLPNAAEPPRPPPICRRRRPTRAAVRS